MTQRVLILGARAPVALDHARRFHQQGWQVHVADSIPCRLSGWSRAVRQSHAVRPPRHDPTGFVADLRRIVREHRIDMLLPTCEEVFHLAHHRACLPRELHVVTERFEVLRELHSKWQFLHIAERCGMPAPSSARVHTLAQAREWAGGEGVVLKPEFSRFGVHVRLYPHGIPDDAKPLEALGAWVVQRFAPGRELCSYSIAHRGRLLAHAVYQPTYRLRRSSSYYFEPVQQPRLREAVAALVRMLDYSGQISFDWMESDSGELRVLECNPRATSGLHLFPFTTDLPAALRGEGELREPAAAPARMIGALMWSAGSLSAIRAGRGAQGWRDAVRARDVITAAHDYAPLPGALADLGSYAALAWRQRCSLREAATRDIEWDGETLETLPP